MDMSPTIISVALPDVNSLGLEPDTTPRPISRSGSQSHRRALSGRDSSPDTTARVNRVRSLGRTSGGASLQGTAEDTAPSRRASRGSDSGTFGEGFAFGDSISGSLLSRSSLPLPPNSPSASMSSSPSISHSANTISRRTSINLVSPPRNFAPPSPSIQRQPRSSLSASLAIPIPAPFPAPPPPVESIKLTKVPESVRSAMDFRLPTGISYLGEALSLPGQSSSGFGEFAFPKTPSGTRAPSPVSNSGSGSVTSDTIRSHPPSESTSRVGSRAPSRRSSAERFATFTPVTLPVHIPGGIQTIPASARIPPTDTLTFPAPAPHPTPTTTRSRAKSVYVPQHTSSNLNPNFSIDPFREVDAPLLGGRMTTIAGAQELGVSPLSIAMSPIASGDGGNSRNDLDDYHPNFKASTSMAPSSGSSFLSAQYRTSIAPDSRIQLPPASENISENTDEYAQIILASRSAKMRKWKTSTSSSIGGSAGHDSTPRRIKETSGSRSGIPSFDEEGELVIGEGRGAEFGLGGANKEVEWVDWLDEYRKMKEAKVRAERLALDPGARSPLILDKVTGKDKGSSKNCCFKIPI